MHVESVVIERSGRHGACGIVAVRDAQQDHRIWWSVERLSGDRVRIGFLHGSHPDWHRLAEQHGDRLGDVILDAMSDRHRVAMSA